MAARSKRKDKDGKSLSGMPMMADRAPTIDKAAQRRYAAEEALRTLTRAAEHQKDKRLMADVRRIAAAEADKMARIAKR